MAREVDLGNVMGPKGDAGDSAYQVWLAQPGNEGKSEQEFLDSLKGAQGEKGEKGDQGDQGPAGPAGATTADGVSYGDSNVEAALDDLADKVADLMYEPIAISSFSNNVGTVEMGSTVNTVVLNWATNKTPTELTLDGEGIDVSLKTKTIESANIKSNKTYTLKATDERDAETTKTTAITFLNGVYWGVAADQSSFDSTFILGLTKGLQSSKAKTFTVNAAAGQHIYYAIPTRYGTPGFKVGGLMADSPRRGRLISPTPADMRSPMTSGNRITQASGTPR